jgi:hypothetical protein
MGLCSGDPGHACVSVVNCEVHAHRHEDSEDSSNQCLLAVRQVVRQHEAGCTTSEVRVANLRGAIRLARKVSRPVLWPQTGESNRKVPPAFQLNHGDVYQQPGSQWSGRHQLGVSVPADCVPKTMRYVIPSAFTPTNAVVVSQVIVGVAARDLSGPQQVELLEVGRGEGRG